MSQDKAWWDRWAAAVRDAPTVGDMDLGGPYPPVTLLSPSQAAARKRRHLRRRRLPLAERTWQGLLALAERSPGQLAALLASLPVPRKGVARGA